VTYGTNAGCTVRAEQLRPDAEGTEFRVRERGTTLGEAHLSAPGLHNVRNALAAICVARELGAEWPAIREGLASYRGVDRRFETVGAAGGVLFVDDYAHHPTEIAATLQAARASHAGRRLFAIFQPHLYSRSRDFAPEFGRALAAADRVVVTDIYAAREKPIPGITGVLIADAARAAGANVRYVQARDDVPDAALEELRPGDLCLTMGAGNLDSAAREMLTRLGGADGGE
jgi:UDP-N-acetylmuramate--alanine ligase